MLGDDPRHEVVDGGLVGDVERFDAGTGGDVGGDDGVPLAPEQGGGRGPDPGGTAGDEGDHGMNVSGSSVNRTTSAPMSRSASSSGCTFAAYCGVSRKDRKPAKSS